MIKQNTFDIGEAALKRLLILVVMSALVACQREEVNPTVVPPQAVSVASTPVAVIVPVSLPPVTSVVAQSTPVKPSVVAKSIEAKPAKTTVGVSVGAPVAANIVPVTTAAVAAITSAQPAPEKLLPTAPTVEAKAHAAVSDADGIALAKKRSCLACHMVDKKIVGPAWRDVAAKYRGDIGAQARLEAKISKGGSGVWGSMAMPAQPQVTADERTLLVRFILNLK